MFCVALLAVPITACAEAGAFVGGDYRSWGVARFSIADDPAAELDHGGINIHGAEDRSIVPRALGIDSLVAGTLAPERLRVTRLKVAWRHRLDADEQLRFSAQYGDVSDELVPARQASHYVAAVGWRGAYTAAGRARIGGSVFVGEEGLNRSGDRTLGRRFFGVSADGSYALLKDHSPFLSLRLQRSDYGVNGAGAGTGELARGSEDLSQFAAGWDWQVYPSWHVRAEAEYALNKSNLSLYEYDANRLFFSTRFDFR